MPKREKEIYRTEIAMGARNIRLQVSDDWIQTSSIEAFYWYIVGNMIRRDIMEATSSQASKPWLEFLNTVGKLPRLLTNDCRILRFVLCKIEKKNSA